MKPVFRTLILALAAASLLACSKSDAGAAAPGAASSEAAIRKNLAARLPNFPAIAEIRKTPIGGLYEVRVGESDIFYSDANGDYLIQGALLDTKARKDLTRARMEALSAIDFMKLPVQDAIVTTRGKGERKLAVFADPNCPYCHKFEKELAKVGNITVYTFVMPILGQDSVTKSQNIWCAPDRVKAWDDWMLRQKPPAPAQCDIEALRRNVAYGHARRISSTPTMVFADGKRVAGATSAAAIEKMLAENK